MNLVTQIHKEIPSNERIKYLAKNLNKFNLSKEFILLINEETNFNFIEDLIDNKWIIFFII